LFALNSVAATLWTHTCPLPSPCLNYYGGKNLQSEHCNADSDTRTLVICPTVTKLPL